MKQNKHKRKEKKYVLITSDNTNTSVIKRNTHPVMLLSIIGIAIIAVGCLVLYFLESDFLYASAMNTQRDLEKTIEDLKDKNSSLDEEVKNLNSSLTAMSSTLEQKTTEETILRASLNEYALPTELPLNKAATMTETSGEEPSFVFEATQGSFVIATATGSVVAINDDLTYGKVIIIDHGNGYKTVYKNAGDVQVKVNDTVMKKMTLFIIGEENTQLTYQILYNDQLINPADMLSING